MNVRQYNSGIPDILKKTEKLLEMRGVSVRKSWRDSEKKPSLPALVFVAGEEYSLQAKDDSSLVMEVGDECRDEKRFDPVVYLLVLFLHEQIESRQDVELAARFIQIAYRFQYNKNSVKGLFFYCKMNNIKNGDRYEEAMSLANGFFKKEAAKTLIEICRGIII